MRKLLERRHLNVAAVALANKNARIVWAMLAHDREFRPQKFNNAADNRGDSHHRAAQAIDAMMARPVKPWLAKPIYRAA